MSDTYSSPTARNTIVSKEALGKVIDTDLPELRSLFTRSPIVLEALDAAEVMIRRRKNLPSADDRPPLVDLIAFLIRQRAWSERTFGPNPRTAGIIAHIRKELDEIAADPTDVTEWIDVVILALDGAWRTGATPEEIVAALLAKLTRNEGREWPNWRTLTDNDPIEHVRE